MLRPHQVSRRVGVLLLLFATALPLVAAPPASADDPDEILRFRFTPTKRAQIALWIEDDNGTFLETVRVTQAVSYRGIGNRPGAFAMNSGFRWPYGRREGVLPVWAHRRASAEGASLFKRVIFQDRLSEGLASRTSNDFSRDDYFCLSFNKATTKKDALDAVSCASVFTSDKGRFMVASDEENGYSEPHESDGKSFMRPMALGSVYPPRRDFESCAPTCNDHEDAALFGQHAKEVMPNIDAVTMATPKGGTEQIIQWPVPADWPAGNYRAFLEINTEGDYSEKFNASTMPTPTSPAGKWDSWAISYGYPYRGQPSVIYQVDFALRNGGPPVVSAATPVGTGALEGVD
ncbi:MAG: hypothetical protein KC416_11305, partial [Myxococcales bacterium]|nr:hypothetical protein [Myxococcales bacterium]